eukprot:COSAG01_NODE_1700_length_9448_cov_53.589475_3_plen_243_part_00
MQNRQCTQGAGLPRRTSSCSVWSRPVAQGTGQRRLQRCLARGRCQQYGSATSSSSSPRMQNHRRRCLRQARVAATTAQPPTGCGEDAHPCQRWSSDGGCDEQGRRTWTAPSSPPLETSTTAPLTRHDGARGWAHDGRRSTDAHSRCGRRTWGLRVLCASGPEGQKAQPFCLVLGQEVFGTQGTIPLPPPGAPSTARASSAQDCTTHMTTLTATDDDDDDTHCYGRHHCLPLLRQLALPELGS